KLGQRSRAIACYRQAAVLNPSWLPPHLNLGSIFLRTSDAAAAEKSYRDAIRLAPESAEAWIGLGCALDEQKSPEVEAVLRKALALDPHHFGAISRLAQWLRGHGRACDAIDLLTVELAANSTHAKLLAELAQIYADVGDVLSAHATYRRLLDLTPTDWDNWSGMLRTLNFVSTGDVDMVYAEHQRFGEAVARALGRPKPASPPHARQRLKLGYVSADFRSHSMACFIEPVLRFHDRQEFEVHCFYNYPTGDELTRRLAVQADHWHDIAGLNDESVAQRIRDNGIDLLVDLSGHTVGNRMGVFARKPAPLQFTWLGYLCTTGLATMDYRICDAYTDPFGAPAVPEAETLARLPHSQWCYQPQAELPLASTLPMLRNGFLTLGSFNHEIKLNEAVIRAWMELLRAVPDSRLRIFGVTTDILDRRIREVCRALDIAGERVEVRGRVEIERYFALYGEVDVALDTFPFNGGTTTCDALIMGVPTVAVAGARALARGGVSLLSNIALTNWIADSPREIVDVVKAQIADPHALAQLRAELPARMRASPLMDAPRFTQDLEALYRSAWQQSGAA
ncbi:MAG: hypothetical protein JSS13_03425, partial [Proteobacteria bacterium]|nr:hypothetical protein [Pseudomonadota bacterium]